MAGSDIGSIADLVGNNEPTILSEWLDLQKQAGILRTGRTTEAELTSQSRNFLHLLREGLAKGGNDVSHASYGPAREMLADMSRSRALQGFSPSETATFIFSLKRPLFDVLSKGNSLSTAQSAELVWSITLLLDGFGLYTLQIFQNCPRRSSSCGMESWRCR
jgi:rsbT co-antagonist protein RsbR